MANQIRTGPYLSEACLGKLAQLLPDAIPVRIPVGVTPLRAAAHGSEERTCVSYATPTEVIFASTLPLELEDRVRLQNSDGTLKAEAAVVAIQYHAAGRAVAARFVGEVRNWIIKR